MIIHQIIRYLHRFRQMENVECSCPTETIIIWWSCLLISASIWKLVTSMLYDVAIRLITIVIDRSDFMGHPYDRLRTRQNVPDLSTNTDSTVDVSHSSLDSATSPPRWTINDTNHLLLKKCSRCFAIKIPVKKCFTCYRQLCVSCISRGQQPSDELCLLRFFYPLWFNFGIRGHIHCADRLHRR
jgi:hypothetical protein